MTRFLISALGSAGDVHPFIAISRALNVRGHDVRMIAAPHFEDRIRRAGVSFIAIGAPGDYEALLQRPELWQPRSGARFILDELLNRLPEGYAITRAALDDAGTVLVGSTLAWGMRIVQEVTGLPAATVHLSPACIQSAIAPPVLPGIGDVSWMPAWSLRILQWAAERLVLDRWIGPRLDALRMPLGLPPARRIWSRWIHSPDLVLCAWPDWFAAPQADWPPGTSTTGFPVYDETGAELDIALTRFLRAGDVPVGITAGSAMAHGRDFFAKAMAACDGAGRRAVLITPYRDQLPAQLPAWAHHVPYAPFSALIPRLAMLIHHGGVGTSAQALQAGIPQLVAPFAHDQFDNAARLRNLRVSRTIEVAASTDRWVAAVHALLGDEAIVTAVRHYAARMRDGEPAADAIARRLEALALAHAATHCQNQGTAMDREKIRASVPAELDGGSPMQLKQQAEAFIAAVLHELETEDREPDAWEALDLAYALTLIEGGMPLAAIHYGRRAITPIDQRGDDLWTRIDDFPSAVQLTGWLAQVKEMPARS